MGRCVTNLQTEERLLFGLLQRHTAGSKATPSWRQYLGAPTHRAGTSIICQRNDRSRPNSPTFRLRIRDNIFGVCCDSSKEDGLEVSEDSFENSGKRWHSRKNRWLREAMATLAALGCATGVADQAEVLVILFVRVDAPSMATVCGVG